MGNHIQTKNPQNNIPTQFIEARNYIYLFFGTLFDDEEIYIFLDFTHVGETGNCNKH